MLLGIIFLTTEQNKLHFLSDQMIFKHCSLQIRQNKYSICIFRPVVTQFIVKVKRKIENSPTFESLPFPYQSTFSECKGVSRASSDRIIYFNKNSDGTKWLICQTIFLNKVPNFLSFFKIFWLKFEPVYKPYSL